MAFSYSPRKETVNFDGGQIEVRGLTFPDLSQLFEVNRDAILPIFEKYRNKPGEQILLEDTGGIIIDFLQAAPVAVTHFICLAADEQDNFNAIAQLPIGAVVQIIERVVDLTFRTNGGAGNLKAIVERMVRSAVAETQAPKTRT